MDGGVSGILTVLAAAPYVPSVGEEKTYEGSPVSRWLSALPRRGRQTALVGRAAQHARRDALEDHDWRIQGSRRLDIIGLPRRILQGIASPNPRHLEVCNGGRLLYRSRGVTSQVAGGARACSVK
jgi:hypothetical protein